ncbi:WxL domain-containing protein [Enterococcus sp. SMC-9]|uniref:WxL domain-containing protein n=1 Tax=Enterococcus sp. SMC-9 TaxID=2862343 RepID=UPI001E2F36F5|nr:WxL domain-containing protein [Enterococcus sp. SMC-9]MCD1025378.1 WxL domain-containing protein [Enterococcus sp. SMC-9]
MKNITKLTTAALLGTMALGVVAPAAHAATDVAGKGYIEFKQEKPENPDPTPGGEDGPEITEPTPNPDPNPLKIVSVTEMDFDINEVPVGNAARSYDVLPFETTKVAPEGEEETPLKTAHFVRYMDVRADGFENHHTIKAELTQQFAHNDHSEKFLDGATLLYKKITLEAGNGTADTNTPSASAVEDAASAEIKEGTQTTIVENKEAGKGRGVFDIIFDKKDDESKYTKKDYKGVSLEVPAAVNMLTGVYTGEVTWTIEDAR